MTLSTSFPFLSYDRGSTFNVFVGKGQLIEGMDKALLGMCVNERRFVKIPPKLAYGSEGVCKYSTAFVNNFVVQEIQFLQLCQTCDSRHWDHKKEL